LLAASADTAVPRRIGVIAIDPFDSRHLCIGGVGHQTPDRRDPGDIGGLYSSSDSGITWRRQNFISDNNYWCHSIRFHPRTRDVLYATFTERGARSGIWRSRDGGQNWDQLTAGLPPPARFGRTSLAISPSDPDVIYVFAMDMASGRSDLLLGVFRSSDGGNTWRDISGNHFRNEMQISYGNTIVVHPTHPNHVLCGGVDLHLTTDGGGQWQKVTRWDARRGANNYAHADHHALVMPAGAPGRVYDANDGGVDVSEDGGSRWSNRSKGLAVTMYYDMDVAQSDGRSFGGGAQDNGTLVTTTGQSDDHFELLGGDGGWIVYDPTEPNHIYASYYNLNIFRWRPGEDPVDVSPPASDGEKGSIWMAFIAMDPSNPRRVFTGSQRVWRTRTDGSSWRAVSPSLDGSPITAIEIARADPRRIYVGTENGGIFASPDGGETWSPDISSASLPGHTITRLQTSPTNADVLYATVANFGHSHVFRSEDGGNTWQDIDRGQLPDVPHHSLAIPPDQPSSLYVCCDAGVFFSTDGGGTWMNLTRNLPNVMVIDLAYQQRDGTLSAATYGRSLWRIQVR
jgi:photosystem II stability/assembly factor-like uncharacterized protein